MTHRGKGSWKQRSLTGTESGPFHQTLPPSLIRPGSLSPVTGILFRIAPLECSPGTCNPRTRSLPAAQTQEHKLLPGMGVEIRPGGLTANLPIRTHGLARSLSEPEVPHPWRGAAGAHGPWDCLGA